MSEISGSHGEDRLAAWERLLAFAIVAGLLGCFAWLIATSYYIKAHSDPYNWLTYAANLREELSRSRWPYGFALFLRIVSNLVGPFFVFLANAPLMALNFLLVLNLGRMVSGVEEARGRHATWAGLSAFVVVAAADAGGFAEYVNPFRDPLSYTFLLGGAALFMDACAKRRAGRFAGSGALLGLAVSVREPSLLMAGPFLLYGLVEWRAARWDARFLLFAGAFALGLAVALLPLLAQTYLATSQILVPPQAAIEGYLLPGIHLRRDVFLNVFGKAAAFYATTQPWLPVAALIGAVAAIVRRQRAVLWLCLPALLVFGGFYAFYRLFVPRYFYIVSLWMSLLAGYGVYTLLPLAGRMTPARARPAVGWVLLVLCAVLAGRQIVGAREPTLRFRIPQARALAHDLNAVLPPDAVVLAPRNLCEVVDLFSRPSYPVPLWGTPDTGMVAALDTHVRGLWAGGRAVFAMEVPWRDAAWRDAPQGDTIHLRRLFDLVLVRSFDPADYRVQLYSAYPFRLNEVRPWSRHALRMNLARPAGETETGWLAIDAGALSVADPTRTWTRVAIDGKATVEPMRDGATYFALRAPGRSAEDPVTVEVSSDGLLPVEMRMRAAPLSTPIDLSMDFLHAFDHWQRWRGEVLPPSPSERVPRLFGAASFDVPVPAPELGNVVLEWRLRSNRRRPGMAHRISFDEDGAALGEADIPCDMQVHGAVVALPPRADRTERRIRITRHPNPEDVLMPPGGAGSPAWVDAVEAYRLFVYRLGASDCLDIEVGGEFDTPFVRIGFHPRPVPHPARQPFRWTTGHGIMDLAVAPKGGDMELHLEYSIRHTPASVEPREPEIRFNGKTIVPESLTADAAGRNLLWTARVAASEVAAANTLEIVSGVWRPCDHDPSSTDDRVLGVLVHRVILRPAAAKTVIGDR